MNGKVSRRPLLASPHAVETAGRGRRAAFVCLVLSLATSLSMIGCASRDRPHPAKTADRPAVPAVATEAPQPVPAKPSTNAVPPASRAAPPRVPAVSSEPPVVVALLEESEASRASGDLESAVATLERALRIHPRNPRLWHELARIRLLQGEAALAVELAGKSSLLSSGDESLIEANRKLIAAARQQLGPAVPAPQSED